jgi:hypothetical protein
MYETRNETGQTYPWRLLSTALRGRDYMIVSVLVQQFKLGASFQDFVGEWGADEVLGVPTVSPGDGVVGKRVPGWAMARVDARCPRR